jgi:hypothetical protein
MVMALDVTPVMLPDILLMFLFGGTGPAASAVIAGIANPTTIAIAMTERILTITGLRRSLNTIFASSHDSMLAI